MTVGALVDRTYRQILEPPDAQPAATRTASSIAEGDLVIPVTLFDIPEDENLLRLGSIIEINSELMRVTDYDTTLRVVTVIRGYLGSVPAAHALDDQVKLSPPYPRLDVFHAVRDNIVALYPDLWTVKTQVLSRASADAYPIEDLLAVEIVEANPNAAQKTVNFPARIVDNHPQVDGRAVVFNGAPSTTMWVRYRRRFGTATSEADTLESLGVDTVWNALIIVSAAADLVSGRDVQAVSSDWVQSALEAENIRVGTRLSVAGGLAQYRDILMGRFKKEMRGEDSNRPKVHIREVFA